MNALTTEEIQARLANVSLKGWTYEENTLQRVYTCQEYLGSLDLLYKIGLMAEAENHHPELLLGYKRLTIRYWTHDSKGVTELDFACAHKAEKLIQQGTY